MDQDDEEVVQRACSGDPLAWEHLYRRVYPRLRGYLARRVGADAAEDAVSETMARAVAGIGRMRPGPAGFDGWVFGIARHVAADHFRGRERSRRQDQAASRSEQPVAPDVSSERMFMDEEHRQIMRAFEMLTDSERELLELRIVAGLSAEQVAEVLGRKPGAVRTAQSRALGRLRTFLEQQTAARPDLAGSGPRLQGGEAR